VERRIREAVGDAGGNIAQLDLLVQGVNISGALEKKFINESKWNAKDDVPDKSRIRAARENVLKMSQPLERLWAGLEAREAAAGKYDFVVFIKDDAFWIQPFNLDLLLREGRTRSPFFRGHADGFAMRCRRGSTYVPPDNEFTEYFFLLNRSIARPFGMVYSSLLGENHTKYFKVHNLEAFYHALAKDNRINIRRMIPNVLPMVRAARLPGKNGASRLCMHKRCVPSNRKKAKQMNVSWLPLCQNLF